MEDSNLFDIFEIEDVKAESKVEVPMVEEPIVEPTSEDEPEEEVEEDEEIDLTSAKTLHSVLKDFGVVGDNDNPTEDFIREELSSFGEKQFINHVQTLPDFMQDTLIWAADKGEVTKEDFVKFVQNFVVEPAHDIETIDGAKQFLSNSKAFKEFYISEDEREDALYLLEDKNKLLEKAKEIFNKEVKAKEEQKAATLKQVADEKDAKMQRDKAFAQSLQKEAASLTWQENRKKEALGNVNTKTISDKWSQIAKDPKGLLQFADILSYMEDGRFDKLYDVLEGKAKSTENKGKLKSIEKDSLSKIIKQAPAKAAKVKHDDSWFN